MEQELCYIDSGNTHFLMTRGQKSDTRIWCRTPNLHNSGFINCMSGMASQQPRIQNSSEINELIRQQYRVI